MDAKAKIEEIQRKRDERREAIQRAKEEQFAKDLEVLASLEEEHGHDAVVRLDMERFVEGQPTFVVIKAPSRAAYKRFQDTMAIAEKGRGQKPLEVHEQFARACWVYPAERAEQEALLESFPGVSLSMSIRAQRFAEARVVDEGKG